MELQWNSIPWSHLKCNVRQVQNQEQTQEIRLDDNMPDIGRVLCAWGQPMLRSKEWRNDEMRVTGGVTVWVVYMPEDGSGPRSVQAWLPFQGKWNFTDSKREGMMRCDCMLRSVDARTLSARRLMVRANLGMLGEALEQTQTEVFQPGELPEQVYALQNVYPVCLYAEAGEKTLDLEESITPSAGVERIMACQLRTSLTEQNVVGSKIVFRGVAYVDVICLDPNDRVYTQVLEIPFAQFADLEKDYDKEALCQVSMAVSHLESELQDNQIHIKCGLIAQYIVRENRNLTVVEDVYSPTRKITPAIQTLTLPTVLDARTEWMDIAQEIPVPQAQPIDCTFLPDHPTCYREGEYTTLDIPGNFQLLYYDADDALQATNETWSDNIPFPAAQSCQISAIIGQIQRPTMMFQGDSVRLNSQLRLDTVTHGSLQLPMVTGLEVGEPIEPNPTRPSLLLQRMGNEDLWTLAKATGSTVEAIRTANGLQNDPMPGEMILIPLL